MLVVRSIDVKPGDERTNEVLKRKVEDVELEGLDDIFGTNKKNEDSASETPTQQPDAPEALKTPVVTDNLSEFSVVIEYV